MTAFEYTRMMFLRAYNFEINSGHAKNFIDDLETEYGTDEVMYAVDIATEQYLDFYEAAIKLKGILYNRRKVYDFWGKDTKKEDNHG